MTDGRSIGQVVDELSPEFPDLTISKIRFLESRGLIAPERAPSGYRRFSDAEVERLRWILGQQRDRFLPLRVIRQLLDTGAWRHGDGPEAATDVADVDAALADTLNDPAANPLVRTAKPRRLKRRDLLDESGLDNDALRALEQLGLVEAVTDDAGRTSFDADALAVARLARRFADHGIEPRHLRAYKVAAEREAALFEQLLVGQLGRPGEDATAELGELVALGTELRAVLIRAALRDHLPADTDTGADTIPAPDRPPGTAASSGIGEDAGEGV